MQYPISNTFFLLFLYPCVFVLLCVDLSYQQYMQKRSKWPKNLLEQSIVSYSKNTQIKVEGGYVVLLE